MQVSNMMSSNNRAVPNQFHISDEFGEYFKSYDSMICFRPKGSLKVYLGHDWDYSRTTGKYRNQFLGLNKAETQTHINNNIFEVVDLDNEAVLAKLRKAVK